MSITSESYCHITSSNDRAPFKSLKETKLVDFLNLAKRFNEVKKIERHPWISATIED